MLKSKIRNGNVITPEEKNEIALEDNYETYRKAAVIFHNRYPHKNMLNDISKIINKILLIEVFTIIQEQTLKIGCHWCDGDGSCCLSLNLQKSRKDVFTIE